MAGSLPVAVNVNLHAVQPLLLELVAYRAAADRGRTAVTEMPMELVVGLQEMLVIDDLEAEKGRWSALRLGRSPTAASAPAGQRRGRE